MTPGFMEAHRSIGEVPTAPYGNRITVAASASRGEGRVAVYGRTVEGQSTGGLLSVERAILLYSMLGEAIEYAQSVADEQAVESIPELERRLAAARRIAGA